MKAMMMMMVVAVMAMAERVYDEEVFYSSWENLSCHYDGDYDEYGMPTMPSELDIQAEIELMWAEDYFPYTGMSLRETAILSIVLEDSDFIDEIRFLEEMHYDYVLSRNAFHQ